MDGEMGTPEVEMRYVCSWCSEYMRGPEDAPVSHGICDDCKQTIMDEVDREHYREGVGD